MENMAKLSPKIIGLTGGIGSGKSTVAREFEKLGVPVFYSDNFAKKAYFDAEAGAEIIALLGAQIFNENQELNTSYIRSRIFSEPALKKKLEQIIHPFVRMGFNDFVKEHSDKTFVINEVALLFENGMQDQFHQVILVYADEEERIQRVMDRDGLDKDVVMKIIHAQLPEIYKLEKANLVVLNHDLIGLKEKVFNIYQFLLKA